MSYYFNLPVITALTEAQQAALNETRPIALTGGPGTGKSVVSLWRHIRNYSLDIRKSVLLTYTRSLCKFLQNSCLTANINNQQDEIRRKEAADNVRKSLSWRRNICGEIIIDEAQDLPITFYNGIKDFANIISYGADKNQSIYPNQCSTEEELRNLFPNNIRYLLDENFRNTYEIVLFARTLFTFHIPQTTLELLQVNGRTGSKPQLLIFNNQPLKQNQAILDIIRQFHSETHNIAILVPLIVAVNNFYEIVNKIYPQCTKFENEMDNCNIGNIHITTFKSAKGLEFDTVIIPDFHNYNYNIANLNVVNENDYYVAITRAKSNLFLISNNDLPFINTTTCGKENL